MGEGGRVSGRVGEGDSVGGWVRVSGRLSEWEGG